MTAALREYRPRVAVDTNVLMEAEWLRRLLLAADLGLLQPVWSPRVVSELARAGLWRLGRRSAGRHAISTEQYAAYRHGLRQRIGQIDIRFEMVRSAHAAPVDEEVAWADAGDHDDLHVQLLARAAQADCVVSWNDRDFPGRRVLGGHPCGELCGVLWITPDQLPTLRTPAVEVTR